MENKERKILIKEGDAEKKETLSLEKTKSLIIEGFKYSQGDNNLLRLIWAVLHNNYPNLRVEDAVIEQAKKELQPALEKLIVFQPGQKQHHVKYDQTVLGKVYFEPFDVTGALDTSTARFRTLINSERNWSVDSLVEQSVLSISQEKRRKYISENSTTTEAVARITVLRDYYYLVVRGSRPTEHGDKFASFLYQYGLAEHPKKTGNSEYARMWSQVGSFVKARIQNKEWTNQNFKELFQMLDSYNAHHPQDQINI